jgi:phage shock protein E
MGLFDSIFGQGKKAAHLKEAYEKGALIVDVRSPEEFKGGHLKNSINIPLHEVATKLESLKKKNKAIIAVCLSGGRSSMAVSILKNAGLEAYNGGPWNSLENKIR